MMMSGRDGIKLLRELFHIKQRNVRKVVITAEVNDAMTMDIQCFPDPEGVDVEASNMVGGMYEITVRRVPKE
jgi:CheY-like chemotaxis protein